MGFGSLAYTKFDYARTLAATFAYYLVAQRDDLVAEQIHAGEHGRVGRGRRDIGTVGALENRAALGEAIHVRRGQPRVAVETHVVGT